MQRYTALKMASEYGLAVDDVVTLAHTLRDYGVRSAADVLAETTVRQFKGAFSRQRTSQLRGRYEALTAAQTRRNLARTEAVELRALESVFYPATPRSGSRRKRGKPRSGGAAGLTETSGLSQPKNQRHTPRRRAESTSDAPISVRGLAEGVGLPTAYIFNLANDFGAQLLSHTDIVPAAIASLIRRRHSRASSRRMLMRYERFVLEQAVAPLTPAELEEFYELKEIFEPPLGAPGHPVDRNEGRPTTNAPRSNQASNDGAATISEAQLRPGAEYDISPWHRRGERLMGHPGSGRRR